MYRLLLTVEGGAVTAAVIPGLPGAVLVVEQLIVECYCKVIVLRALVVGCRTFVEDLLGDVCVK